jgi:hypothetical protein
MRRIEISEEINHHRRRFFGAAAMTIAAAQLGIVGAANAQAGKTEPTRLPAIRPGTNTSFTSLKQIDAGVLNVGYAEAGPGDGLWLSFCMAGPTTFTAMSMLPLCWRRRATG